MPSPSAPPVLISLLARRQFSSVLQDRNQELEGLISLVHLVEPVRLVGPMEQVLVLLSLKIPLPQAHRSYQSTPLMVPDKHVRDRLHFYLLVRQKHYYREHPFARPVAWVYESHGPV